MTNDFFEDGFIYCIEDNQGNIIYIGSTKNLQKRLYQHIGFIERQEQKPLYQYIAENEIHIELKILEQFKNINKKDLLQKEKYYIEHQIFNENMFLQNQNKPLLTPEEKQRYDQLRAVKYRMENYERIKQKQQLDREKKQQQDKKYREKNKETLRQKQSQIMQCYCGKNYTKSNKARHEKTDQIHLNFQQI